MTSPLPLSAPDGTVLAWVCPVCRRRLWPSASPPRAGMCDECLIDGMVAFETLACIGIAAATDAAFRATHGFDDPPYSVAWFVVGHDRAVALAALCGVTVEMVRGWR